MSMLAFASPLAWGHHFEVDGAVDADDRAHLLHLYGGNALTGAVASINLRIKFGDSVLLATGALTPPSGASGIPFEIQGFFVVRALGSPATLSVSGRYDNGQSSGLLAEATEVAPPVNSTIDNDLHATIQFGVASASNSATVQNIIIEKYAPV